MRPTVKPAIANFSSGPCAKRPGYDVSALQLNTLGRSHRSAVGKKALALACSDTARLLGLLAAPAPRRRAAEAVRWWHASAGSLVGGG